MGAKIEKVGNKITVKKPALDPLAVAGKWGDAEIEAAFREIVQTLREFNLRLKKAKI